MVVPPHDGQCIGLNQLDVKQLRQPFGKAKGELGDETYKQVSVELHKQFKTDLEVWMTWQNVSFAPTM